ncbi:hypothetical protein AX16_006033 [Volvariella volvacea WC 439]|nr:hypothetical protein AX16_006033 [Volvariella volvacea WC 439]
MPSTKRRTASAAKASKSFKTKEAHTAHVRQLLESLTGEMKALRENWGDDVYHEVGVSLLNALPELPDTSSASTTRATQHPLKDSTNTVQFIEDGENQVNNEGRVGVEEVGKGKAGATPAEDKPQTRSRTRSIGSALHKDTKGEKADKEGEEEKNGKQPMPHTSTVAHATRSTPGIKVPFRATQIVGEASPLSYEDIQAARTLLFLKYGKWPEDVKTDVEEAGSKARVTRKLPARKRKAADK